MTDETDTTANSPAEIDLVPPAFMHRTPAGKPPKLPPVPSMVPPDPAIEKRAEGQPPGQALRAIVREAIASPVFARLPIKKIIIGDRLLPLDDEHVKELAESIARDGLLNPILVNRRGCRLIAGRHRLAAAVRLGWEDIHCMALDIDEVEERILEIVENLRRLNLCIPATVNRVL